MGVGNQNGGKMEGWRTRGNTLQIHGRVEGSVKNMARR
jgi:hypothetical protein